MANLISSAINANSVSSQVAAALGYNNWELKTGKFNGCTFCNFAPLPLLQSNPLFNDGVNVVANINQFTGNNLLGSLVGADANGIGNLYDTVLGLIAMREDYIPQVVVKPLPFAGKTNTERMGGGGYEFQFTLLYIGQDYMKAIQNLENVIKNPSPQSENYLVLEHPTRGKITGVSNPIGWSVNSNVGLYNGAVIQFTIRSEQSNIAGIAAASLTQKIFNAINSSLSLITDINATIAVLQARFTSSANLFGGGSNVQGSPRATVTRVNNVATSVNQLTAKLFDNVNYVYKKSTSRASISQLDNVPINTANIPNSLNTGLSIGSLKNYNATQGDIILQYYINAAEESLAVIEASGLAGQANDLIVQIEESVAAIYNVCNLSAQVNTTFSFTTPYTMSLYQALYLNGISFNAAPDILINNPQIKSANYLEAGTVISL